MDSPIAERTRSKLKRKALESKIIPSKRTCFYQSYRHQRFALPDSIMHYISKNPSSTKVYQKLIESCKFYFHKNPILICRKLHYDDDGWSMQINGVLEKIQLKNMLCRFWVTRDLYVASENGNNSNVASEIIQKLYQCDVRHLSLGKQLITLKELLFFASNVQSIDFRFVTVKNENGTAVPIEEILGALGNVEHFTYSNNPETSAITAATVKELLKIPQFLTLEYFDLKNITEDFDIESFFEYIKKNTSKSIRLHFCDTISDEYKIRVNAVVDEIILAFHYSYRPPMILYPGLDQERRRRLCRRCYA